MTARHSLDQIVRGLDGVTAGPERIWLQSYEDSTAVGEDRLWCEDKVWPNDPEDHEPTEYVRADLFREIEERLATATQALEPFASAAAAFDPPENDDDFLTWGTKFTIGDLRRARTALSQIRSQK